ncbi:cob(I)yrinic acid a,c-diamide adenosyltransferase [Ethanoligenens harbinense]|uniref:ATP:corrinoid adenosyltransferase BtuR/CobO/CobP n=1 Tax=Ethanoligenens harbinense (strain DSM 18485 / JCM 12961 / CGMCC 1.5033 / YUAN-3) TaxID=663278 RepID=E6U2U0_ETHHY|nr:cob(I)yrinic acid a,c-diamide adenosyltransferase [Ethanoligenens harbinense]ADU27482.1 ATP:corrinoid adenosyltransferase BtuR/CobO/CobP [Ethanoligenens harbinense YUAN-3]AVQ97454.1 ATP--corrinoid adenosyltransferase BtuR/CobO/CobP [Ethanoligenens harbinense YUAN-3]AYF40111.1 ATP--corrinoid adenosyltransferase BtuR/CobO/CobP [Ethanoligenens harbinense]AYF42951.1 ATP--corrinoid adenosyltransferase BtuR/CobO/CobP [Ethanoligenens harbinense]QCN93709.1 ATP--corrinoid adenosyltransferase BtuR/Co
MAETGLVHIYTGDGKGKTTAAMGLACRAAGAGLRVLVVQFLKGRDTGELYSLRRLGIRVLRTDVKKFIPYMDEAERAVCREGQERCFREACAALPQYDLVVLDEAIGAASAGMLDPAALLACVRGRPKGVELVLTGRDAPQALIDCADYVSEIRCVKHPYDRGIQARRGIEF